MSITTDTKDLEPATGRNPAPLEGIRVLDLSRVASGPICTMLLADLGASVIKVERPPEGDEMRAANGGRTGYFMGINRGKQSLALELSSPEDREIAYKLAKQADIVIENFRLGVAERLGMGYEDLRKHNDKIIYCSISSFGRKGPWKDRLAYDIIAEAVTGIMAITGEPDRGPAKAGPPVADVSCGLMALIGILAALVARERTRQGQRVDTSLAGAALVLSVPFLTARATGIPFGRVGGAHNTMAPYQSFLGSDGKWFILAVAKDTFWQRLLTLIGMEHLRLDPRFVTNADRAKNRPALAAILQEAFGKDTSVNWVEKLEGVGIPAIECLDYDEVGTAEHFRENGYVREFEDWEFGKVPFVMLPLSFSFSDSCPATRMPPVLDQDGDAIRQALAEGRDVWTLVERTAD